MNLNLTDFVHSKFSFGQVFGSISRKSFFMATSDKVLIIEDSKDTCYLLEQILEMVGIESSCAETLKESDCMLQRFHPASVFVDNNLPDGSGFDYIPKLRELYPEIKIIAMTANFSINGKKKAISNGADYYLQKPFTINQVLNAVLDRKTDGNSLWSPN